MSVELRGICQKYENDLKQLGMQLEEEKERSIDYEMQLKSKVSILEENEIKWAESESHYKQVLSSSQE